MTDSAAPPFVRLGPEHPRSPVILSVPHAGRAYRPGLIDAARVGPPLLETLEDRLVDRLIWRATAAGATAFVAHSPRAEIDLNRDEREIDPAMVSPPLPASRVLQTVRSRGGIGLVPSRINGIGPLWRGRLPREELQRRIEEIHRPYHAALEEALSQARRRFGAALLLDCHSMPPRPDGPAAGQIILGDVHGTSCAADLTGLAFDLIAAHGFRPALNSPYAGGYITRRHGRPAEQVHALQIEIDRSTYLDRDLKSPGAGFPQICALVEALAAALAERLGAANLPLAAE